MLNLRVHKHADTFDNIDREYQLLALAVTFEALSDNPESELVQSCQVIIVCLNKQWAVLFDTDKHAIEGNLFQNWLL